MEKASNTIFVEVAPPKPSFWARAIGWAGMLGGGYLGAKLGLNAYGEQPPVAEIDITKPAPWEIKAPQPIVDAEQKAVDLANAELQHVLRQSGSPDAALSNHETLGVNGKPQQATPIMDESLNVWPADKPVPKVVSASVVRDLEDVLHGNAEVEQLVVKRHNTGFHADIHLENGGKIHIPHIDAAPYSAAMGHMRIGESVSLKGHADLGMLSARGGLIDSALHARKSAMAKEIPGLKTAHWGGLKSLQSMSGVTKFNVASMTLMGVVMGGFLASGIASLFRGAQSAVSGGTISHEGRVSAPQAEINLPKAR